MAAKKKAMGRGLGALIDDAKYEKKTVREAISTSAISEIDIDDIKINPFQPRVEFDEDALAELSQSIKELGIIQPITVRKIKNKEFQIISGERRFRASKLAGLKKIIAFVRDADDQKMLEMALVENIQREDLNAVEVAVTYQRLMDECQLTQEKLSERVGKKRTTVSNYLRLLKLPADIQVAVRDKKIAMGHARALISIEDENAQMKVFYRVVAEGLSVRAVEQLVRELNSPVKKELKKQKNPISLPEKHVAYKNKMTEKFATDVEIKRNEKGKGSLVIAFKDDDEFERIMNLIQESRN